MKLTPEELVTAVNASISTEREKALAAYLTEMLDIIYAVQDVIEAYSGQGVHEAEDALGSIDSIVDTVGRK